VIGCATGVLGVSELAALATGAPLVHGGTVPDAVDAVRALLTGSHQHDPEAACRWACDAHVPGLARSGQRPYVRDVILRDGGRTNRGALFVAGPAAPERFDGRP
jgi:hypothetical protein